MAEKSLIGWQNPNWLFSEACPPRYQKPVRYSTLASLFTKQRFLILHLHTTELFLNSSIWLEFSGAVQKIIPRSELARVVLTLFAPTCSLSSCSNSFIAFSSVLLRSLIINSGRFDPVGDDVPDTVVVTIVAVPEHALVVTHEVVVLVRTVEPELEGKYDVDMEKISVHRDMAVWVHVDWGCVVEGVVEWALEGGDVDEAGWVLVGLAVDWADYFPELGWFSFVLSFLISSPIVLIAPLNESMSLIDGWTPLTTPSKLSKTWSAQVTSFPIFPAKLAMSDIRLRLRLLPEHWTLLVSGLLGKSSRYVLILLLASWIWFW